MKPDYKHNPILQHTILWIATFIIRAQTMKFFAWIFFLLIVMAACSKQKGQDEQIVYHDLNAEIVLPTNKTDLQNSTNAGAMHADSILAGYIQAEYVTTGLWPHDLDGDGNADISFDIIDLHKFNPQGIPQSFDTLAARVHPVQTTEILDNSTYGYPDALDEQVEVGPNHFWNHRQNFVLGTFLTAGNFKGAGDKYLGFRFADGNGHHYGWVKLYVSAQNDTLRLYSFAWHKVVDEPILTGQLSTIAN